MNSHSIDWHAVLGPILSSASEVSGAGLSEEELDQLEWATFQHARRAVRLRPELSDAELPFRHEPVPWFPRGWFVADREKEMPARPGAFLQYAAGDYTIQDAGSMLALALCDISPGQWVCDTCAAPGGKSTGLLELLAGDGLLVSNEVIASRLGILNLILARSGYGNYVVTSLDVDRLQQMCGSAFDRVLVDAPCTGQTLVSRGKQSMAAFGRSQIAHSSARQLRILRAAAGLVKAGGRLVYSTCAYSYAENEGMILNFLDEHSDWALGSVRGLEAWRSPVVDGCYRVWPHRDGCAGAFAALLVRREADRADRVAGHERHPRPPSTNGGWRRIDALPDSIKWLQEIEPGQWWQSGNKLHRLDPVIPGEWIRHAVSGTLVAENRSSRWEPMFASSTLVGSICRPLHICQLDDQQAIRFVGGEAIRCDREQVDWCVATWRERPLSWGKMTQGTLKNHFPKALRQTNLVCP